MNFICISLLALSPKIFIKKDVSPIKIQLIQEKVKCSSRARHRIKKYCLFNAICCIFVWTKNNWLILQSSLETLKHVFQAKWIIFKGYVNNKENIYLFSYCLSSSEKPFSLDELCTQLEFTEATISLIRSPVLFEKGANLLLHCQCFAHYVAITLKKQCRGKTLKRLLETDFTCSFLLSSLLSCWFF